LNAGLGDGSCRFLTQNIDALVLKAIVGAGDGNAVTID
jgi:hypothetical protein